MHRRRRLPGGHPLPIVVRRAGWIDTRGQCGTLLGLFDSVDIADDRVGLGPGDALVFCTDGITEARPEGGDLFSEEGLPTTLLRCAADGRDAQQIADALVAQAQAHAGGVVHDDVAVLVVRVPPDVEALSHLAGNAGVGQDAVELPGYPVGEPWWGRNARPSPPREARLGLHAGATAAANSRRFLTGVLHSWRMSEMVDGDAELLTSELVTNAVRHGREAFTVIVRYDGSWLRVEVGDGSPAVPTLTEPGADALGGRGVFLVDRLADRWGTQATADGKRVWFDLAVPPAAGSPPA
jgi:anti-sigma regulatory factor (Ser/Thr protein kinase)